MSGYFFLHLRDRATMPVAHGNDDPDRDRMLAEPGRVDAWAGLDLTVEGSPTDYLANDVGVRLCSERLKRLIDEWRGPDDGAEWLEARVVSNDGTQHAYYVLRFSHYPDVLDDRRTIRARGDFVVKPVLSSARVGGHRVFSFPGGFTRVIVAADVREAIERHRCTGVDFGKVVVI